MKRQDVIKYLRYLKARELKNNDYWLSNAPYIDNVIKLLKEKK